MEGGFRVLYVGLGVCVGICRSWAERGELIGGLSRLLGFKEVYSIGVVEIVSTMVRLVIELGVLSGVLLGLLEWLWWQGAGNRRGEVRRRVKGLVEGALIGAILLSSSSYLVQTLVSWIEGVGEGCQIESLMTLQRELELIEGVGLGLVLMFSVLMIRGLSRRKRYGLIGVISLLVTPPEVEHLLKLMGVMVVLVELREVMRKKERNSERWHKWI